MTLIGKVLAGRYEILEEIGNGGMAVVYKAKCQLLNRIVAVKVLRPDLQNDEEFVRRFNVEAQAAASLAHPNIVSIYDVGCEEGLHYIVMEYVEGKTLKEYIEEKHMLPWREAVDYAIQIAKGLEQAHKNSIIHRDIKPHNIIMSQDGILKVTDFGIARANVQTTMTCDDSAIGSVHYISPEQARGGYTDERSDIYSLAVVLYEMLAGKVPFDSERPLSVAIMHLQDKPISPREYNISIPLALEKIVLKAMSKEVSARYRNVSELINELQTLLGNNTAVITETSTEPDVEKSSGFHIATNLDSDDLAGDMGATKIIPTDSVQEEMNKNAQNASSDSLTDNAKGQNSRHPDLGIADQKEEDIIKKDDTIVIPTVPEDGVKPIKPKKEKPDIDKKKSRRVILLAVLSAFVFVVVLSLICFESFGLLNVCSDPEVPSIPNVVGWDYDEAVKKHENLDDKEAKYHFDLVRRNNVKSDKPEGTILAQTPEPGTKVPLNSSGIIEISLTVSIGDDRITLDDYTKSDKEDAKVKLRNLGMEVEIQEVYSSDIPKGLVVQQNPQAGSSVEKGTKIKLYVSKGPNEDDEAQEVPNLIGKSDMDEIRRTVERRGFKLETEEQHHDDVPMGEVIGQRPEPGTLMDPGEKITVIISTGPEEDHGGGDHGGGEGNNGSSGDGNERQKKTNYLTVYGPRNSDSAHVEVKVDGDMVYDATINKGQDVTLRVESYKDEVEVEIYYDGKLEHKDILVM